MTGPALLNSFTMVNDLFVPKNGKRVNWYSCGPTVDDQLHLGHARSYISFDILRRVLSDYFGYQVIYAVSITDIDDKIIKTARQDYLYKKYVQQNHSVKSVLADGVEVVIHLWDLIKNAKNPALKTVYKSWKESMTVALQPLEKLMSQKSVDTSEALNHFLAASRQPFSSWLDKEKGASVIDDSIFSAISKKFEEEFHAEMKLLNVKPPDVIMRVSEYVPEIVSYINAIIKNGYAYESNGSVYFSVSKFKRSKKHNYGKLVPEAVGDAVILQEGEGELTTNEAKRSKFDFVLWKASKPGEPSWDNPWGTGRPGWHIQCSAMASAVFKNNVDIHSGGVDLKFPHHDNEIALAEAYYKCEHWAKYFLHSGHLTVAGCKMSKSLGNAIPIKDALKKYTARQLRIAFLMHSWSETIDYSDNIMELATEYEKMLYEFFMAVKVLIESNATSEPSKTYKKWGVEDHELMEKFLRTQAMIHTALSNSIDTPKVLELIREIVSSCDSAVSNGTVDVRILQRVACYVSQLMTIFGALGFPIAFQNLYFDSNVMPCLNEILQTCKRLGDELLPPLGVPLEDTVVP